MPNEGKLQREWFRRAGLGEVKKNEKSKCRRYTLGAYKKFPRSCFIRLMTGRSGRSLVIAENKVVWKALVGCRNAGSLVGTNFEAFLAALDHAAARPAYYVRDPWDGGAIDTSRVCLKQRSLTAAACMIHHQPSITPAQREKGKSSMTKERTIMRKEGLRIYAQLHRSLLTSTHS